MSRNCKIKNNALFGIERTKGKRKPKCKMKYNEKTISSTKWDKDAKEQRG